MFLLPIKLDRVSFETKGRQNLQKTADFLTESIVFCPLVPPSWISLVDPTSAMYASATYVSYIYGVELLPPRECTSSLCVEFSTETSQSRISLANCKSNYLCTSQNLLSLAKGSLVPRRSIVFIEISSN